MNEKRKKVRKRGMGSIYKHGRSWYIAYYIEGKQVKEKIGSIGLVTKGQAEQALKARLGEVVQGRFKIEDVKNSIYIKDLIDKYLKWIEDNQKTTSREKQVTKTFFKFIGNNRVNQISTWDIEQYKSKRKKDGLKPSTINRELNVLRSMFNRAKEWGEIQENPLDNVKKALPLKAEDHERESKHIPNQVFEEIINNANDNLKSFLIVARNTGMRVSEIVSLKCNDIDLANEFILIRDSKNYTQRKVPMNSTVRGIFEVNTRDKYFEDKVFNYANKNSVGKSFRRLLQRLKMQGLYRLHDIRHSFITDLVTRGFDMKTIMEITGHKDIRMLIERYTHPTDEHKKEAVETIILIPKNSPNKVIKHAMSKNNPDIWKDDVLNRREVADSLYKFLINRKAPYVLALDSGWGTGKTFFVTHLHEQLNSKGFKSLYYDAWKYDYFHNPLITIVEEFEQSFDIPEDVLKNLKHIAKMIAIKSIPSIINLTGTLIPGGSIIGNIASIVTKKFNKITSSDSGMGKDDKKMLVMINEFKTALKKVIGELRKEGYDNNLFIFIDVLDRCRPTYAIELLEVIKHFFDVENIIIIVSIYTEQLANSIRAIYGSKFDAEGYLSRLFNREFKLPPPNETNYCDLLWNDLNFEKFNEKDNPNLLKVLKESIYQSAIYFKLDLRQLTKVFDILEYLLIDLEQQHEIIFIILPFFTSLKVKDSDLFNMLYHEEFDINDKLIEKYKSYQNFKSIKYNRPDWIISYFMTKINSSNLNYLDDLNSHFGTITLKQNKTQDDFERMHLYAFFRDLVTKSSNNFQESNFTKYLLAKLEFTEKLIK